MMGRHLLQGLGVVHCSGLGLHVCMARGSIYLSPPDNELCWECLETQQITRIF